MLRRAAEIEQASPLGISYAHTDVTAADALRQGRFESPVDLAVCSFGLSDIDDLGAAIATLSAALRPGGWFVFTILHPCFGGGTDIAGSWPRSGRYFDEGRWTPADSKSALRRQVGASHRMLSTYLNALREHDLWLDRVAEPEPEPSWNPAHDADRQPVFLAARCQKAASKASSDGR